MDEASFDIDGDGITEPCYMIYGYTSGLFTFNFSLLEKDRNSAYDYFETYYSLAGSHSFIERDGILTLYEITKLFADGFPEGEYVICKPVTLEDENGNRTTREYTYVFYAYR